MMRTKGQFCQLRNEKPQMCYEIEKKNKKKMVQIMTVVGNSSIFVFKKDKLKQTS